MNLLFFDIECASVFKTTAKICAFGYVLCDEKFNIIEKKDILINPKGKFHLTDRKGQKGLVLPYEYDSFKTQPVFTEVYPQILSLLQNKDTVVVGHSTVNDVKYLDLETRRFNLPSFNFNYSDTQIIYMTKEKVFHRQFGLEFITEDLSVEFTPHRAADDAFATMKICEAMCKSLKCNFFQLEKKLGIIHGSICEHKITRPTSKAYDKYCADLQIAKQKRAKTRTEFFRFVNRKKSKATGELSGKIFNFSREIEDDLPLAKKMVNAIYDKGGSYSSKLSNCNVYVSNENDDTTRTKVALSMESVSVLTLNQAKAVLNV
ncbi:MAG: 3'-5' exonuclease [Clostridiales bacterium]|nr:3'-5' exonuclease [Clostridiales bacterium]